MLKKEVEIGSVYLARIGGRFTKVRIDREVEGYKNRTNWLATNLGSGRQVRIKSAAKLRSKIADTEQVQK